MKKGRIILGALAVVATVGSALALNANSKRANANLFTTGTPAARCVNKVACATTGTAACTITVPLYTITTGTCRIYTGSKFASSL
jgi:hypothetical protein